MTCKNCGYCIAHGYCTHCNKYCGCSFDPNSLNDFCWYHRPKRVKPLLNDMRSTINTLITTNGGS